MDRQRFISVPKDMKAMEDYDLGQDKPDQMIEWQITEEEFNKLLKLGVFNRLNDECDIIIDDFESEVITFDKLLKAKKLLHKLQSEYNSKEIIKLKEMIEDAIDKKTLIAFDF